MRKKTTTKVLELVRLAAFTVAVAAAGLGSTVFADPPPDYCEEYKNVDCACGVAYCDSGGYGGSMACSLLHCSFAADVNCGTPPNNDYRTFCKNCNPCS